jgi:hypothetical protein
MIQEMHLLLGNSIIPVGQRIVITFGHNRNFYKEFYDLHYKLVLKINLLSAPTIQEVGNVLFYSSSLHLPSSNTEAIWHIKVQFSKKL